MKQLSVIFTVLAALSFVNSSAEIARHYWAMATIKKGSEKPIITQYHSVAETAASGIEYFRVIDDSYLHSEDKSYNPVKLQYGYRWADKRLYIYDFESQKEALAIDLTLAPGDHFTTLNEMEWTVEAVKDTLVNVSDCGLGECVTKRLLSVKSTNGQWHDRWLEDFGSLTDFFMMNSLDDVMCSQSLWWEYNEGEYLARQINADPLYGHDTGWLETEDDETGEEGYVKCYLEDENVIFENVHKQYEYRAYYVFYRNGDDIDYVDGWELRPHSDGDYLGLKRDVIIFMGVPSPASGNYTVHFSGKDYSTSGIIPIYTDTKQIGNYYDLMGRRVGRDVPADPGIYIHQGKKIVVR